MKLTLDKSVNAAYIYLSNDIGPGEITFTYPCDPNEINRNMIHLDFDKNFVLRGIEVLGADKVLPKELLDQAEVIG
jgi:hypothetical protein